jgi:hypothetical protein
MINIKIDDIRYSYVDKHFHVTCISCKNFAVVENLPYAVRRYVMDQFINPFFLVFTVVGASTAILITMYDSFQTCITFLVIYVVAVAAFFFYCFGEENGKN